GHELFRIRSEQLNVGANRGVILQRGLLLDGVFGCLEGLFGSDHDDPYLDRDYYILDSITIGDVPTGVVVQPVAPTAIPLGTAWNCLGMRDPEASRGDLRVKLRISFPDQPNHR